jgi:ATP-grasp domain
MLILLSDGAGLTARQCATLLARDGHRVEAVSPDPLCLCRLTRHVRAVHRVPGFGADPFGWLDAALDIAGRRGAELLLPVQEQVSVMALARDRIVAAGLLTAVPDFGALAQVQDKLSAYRTLARAGLPQPSASIATSRAELEASGGLPAFVKTPIGTASSGVRLVGSAAELRQAAARYERDGVFAAGGVLVQEQVSGPLVMIQSVFAHGELVAFHACERVREGAGGGASHKRGLRLPEAREHIARLGAELGWHGALSADIILSAQGPQLIDINPRLVEPVNAYLSGTDLVGTLIEVARCGTARHPAAGARDRQGVRTHQLLLAVLGAARGQGRLAVARELWDALSRGGDYRESTEELTPLRGDPLAAVPVTVAALATLIRPAMWQYFAGGAVGAYSLTPGGWNQLTSAWREAGGACSGHDEGAAG